MAIIYALLASCSWGLSDFIGGFASRRFGMVTVLLLIQAGGLVVAGVVLLIVSPAMLSGPDALLACGAGLIAVTGLACLYSAFAIGTMSVVAPVASAGVVLPVLVGLLGGDRPSSAQLIGLAVIVTGVMLASRERSETHAERHAARLSVLLALIAGLCLSSFYIFVRTPAEHSILWTVILVRAAPLPIIAAFWWRSGAGLPRPRLAAGILAAGSIDYLATFLIAAASRGGDLAIVSVLGSMYPVVTVMLAAAVLRERVRPSQYVGVAMALIGVGAVAGG